jgi:hypothetical protein
MENGGGNKVVKMRSIVSNAGHNVTLCQKYDCWYTLKGTETVVLDLSEIISITMGWGASGRSLA